MLERGVEPRKSGHQPREWPVESVGEPAQGDRCGQRSDGRFGHGHVSAVRTGQGQPIGVRCQGENLIRQRIS
jgi:hypothetical protein